MHFLSVLSVFDFPWFFIVVLCLPFLKSYILIPFSQYVDKGVFKYDSSR